MAVVLVTGIHPQNLGAVQMLLSIRQALPEHAIAVPWDWPAQQFGLARVGRENWTGRADAPVKMRVRAWLRERVGLARRPDLVLDASGFGLSDQWGALKAGRHATNVTYWAQRGVPTVYLPQAFGPFNKPDVAEAAKAALSGSALVFARDSTSSAFLDDLGVAHQRAPDFTCGLSVEPDDRFAGRDLVVPNVRMLEQVDGATYRERMTELLRDLADPVVMVHEDGADRVLAEELVVASGRDLDIVVATDPLQAKAWIQGAGGVIASRYHALVAALDAGIPAVGTGWSHKYEALFEEFEAPDLLIRDMKPTSWRQALDARQAPHPLAPGHARRVAATQEMWRQVRALAPLSGQAA